MNDESGEEDNRLDFTIRVYGEGAWVHVYSSQLKLYSDYALSRAEGIEAFISSLKSITGRSPVIGVKIADATYKKTRKPRKGRKTDL